MTWWNESWGQIAKKDAAPQIIDGVTLVDEHVLLIHRPGQSDRNAR